MTAHAMASPFRRAATVPSGSAARCPAKGPPEPAGGPASGGPSDATPSSAGGQPGARVTTSPIHDNRHGKPWPSPLGAVASPQPASQGPPRELPQENRAATTRGATCENLGDPTQRSGVDSRGGARHKAWLRAASGANADARAAQVAQPTSA
ncbi:unnamed protein product [Lampetra fluviatilis]